MAGTFLAKPAFAWKPSARPALTHGVESGDATADSAVVWTRADRPGRLWVQVGRRPDFRGARLVRGPALTPGTDLTGKVRLRRSTATWKIIANDLPLGLVVPDDPGTQEGVAQGDDGKPLGRELEFATVLRDAHRHGVTGIVFLTADVHYTAAHHYDPARAAVQDFTPFWEFVSGPAHAGAFGPNRLDGTFGPQAVFVHAPPVANTSPAAGYQHFGEVGIDGHSGALTVDLRDRDGVSLWSTTLPASKR